MWLQPRNVTTTWKRDYIPEDKDTFNQDRWKAILWSKIRQLQHGIDHLKSTANYSFKILCCRKFVDLSNEMLYILVSQGANKLPDVKVWGLIKKILRANSNEDLLSKSVFECAHTRFFFKPQSLTSGSLSAPWDTRMYSTSFERSTLYLFWSQIFRDLGWLLGSFRLSQSTLILLHRRTLVLKWMFFTVASLSKKVRCFYIIWQKGI